MINKILLRELENKEKVHEIFEHQISKDLNELAEVIRKEYPNDLLVMFDPKEYKDKVEKIISKETEEYRYGETWNFALIQQTAMKIVDQYIALKIFENLSTKNTPLTLITNHKSCGYCHALKTQIAILVDGTVVPCCLDSNGIIDLGNIYQESLEEIQNKERYQKLKKSFQDRKPSEELCRSCTFKEKR